MVAMATATLSPTDVDKFSHLKSVVVALSQIQSLLFLFSNFLHRSFASSQSWIWTSLFLIPFFFVFNARKEKGDMNFKFEKGFSSTGEVNVATTGSTADDVVMKGGVMSL